MHRRFVYVTAVAIVLGCGDEPVGVERSASGATEPAVFARNAVGNPEIETTGRERAGQSYMFGGQQFDGPVAQGALFVGEPDLAVKATGSDMYAALTLEVPTNSIDWAFNVSSSTGAFFMNGPTLGSDAIILYPGGLGYGIKLNGTDSLHLIGATEIQCSGTCTGSEGQLSVANLDAGGLMTNLCADADGTSVIARCAASSIRFKEHVEDLDRGLETIHALRPVMFRWKTDGSEDLGFVAEEVAELDSLLATYDETGAARGVKYQQMTALLTKGIQELSVTVERQNAEIEMLKALVHDLLHDGSAIRRPDVGGAR